MIAVSGQGSNERLVDGLSILLGILGVGSVLVIVACTGYLVAALVVLPILRAHVDRTNRVDAAARAEKSRAWREVQRRAWSDPDPAAWSRRFDRSAS